MRITTLLLPIVALILLTAPAAGFAQAAGSPKSVAAFAGDSAAILRPDGSSPTPAEHSPSSWKLNAMNSQPVCYTMRTYVVARDTPGSDATHVASYHDCLPSWKLDMRTSEQKDTPAGAPAK
jgi:hypothetical protein